MKYHIYNIQYRPFIWSILAIKVAMLVCLTLKVWIKKNFYFISSGCIPHNGIGLELADDKVFGKDFSMRLL